MLRQLTCCSVPVCGQLSSHQWVPTRLSGSHSGAQSKERGSFGKDNRRCRVRSEHATLAVTAERHNDQGVMPMQAFVHVFVEANSSCQAGRALCHCRAGCIKDSKRQHIRLTQQVRNRPIHELSRDLLIGKNGRIPSSTMQSIRPRVVLSAVLRVGVRYERRR